jgi:hypothetical protein
MRNRNDNIFSLNLFCLNKRQFNLKIQKNIVLKKVTILNLIRHKSKKGYYTIDSYIL